MPKAIRDVDVLQQYIAGVMERADHHADEVAAIALALAGAVVWRQEGPLKVLERSGKMANALWFVAGGQRYFLSYNHKAKKVELRRTSMRGKTLAQFDNATPIAEVMRCFQAL